LDDESTVCSIAIWGNDKIELIQGWLAGLRKQ